MVKPRIWPRSNGHKNSEKIKEWKPKHIVLLCHIVSIQVDKQGLNNKLDKSCIYPLTLNSVLWSQAWREVVLGFKHGNFKKLPKASHFWVTKKDSGLPFHFHVLNLFKSWSNLWFDQIQMGIKIGRNGTWITIQENTR